MTNDNTNTMMYGDESLANGDPVVAYVWYDNDDTPATTTSLGTGFESWEDLNGQAAYASEHGSPTKNIHRQNAETLYLATRIQFFTPAAEMTFHD